MGIGGSPEGVLAAAAVRCTGGAIQCKPWPRNEEERQAAIERGTDVDHIYDTHELVGGRTSSFPPPARAPANSCAVSTSSRAARPRSRSSCAPAPAPSAGSTPSTISTASTRSATSPDPRMASLGTPLSPTATRLLLLGSGELGKEVAIEAQRLGVEVIAVDRYPNAPAMQVAHRAHVFSMLDSDALRRIVELERPHLIVPEVEAIATPTLVELESEGWRVIPTARAVRLTMDREGIRRLAAEELGLRTSPVPVRRQRGRSSSRRRGHRSPRHREACHELLRPRPERRSNNGRHRPRRGAPPSRTPAATAPVSSSRGSSRSTTRSRCSPSATRAGRPSANPSVTCRSMATTASRGSPSP